MSLDMGIIHGKEHRKPYRGAEAVDKSTRCHGGEDWALSDRLHSDRKGRGMAQLLIEEARQK